MPLERGLFKQIIGKFQQCRVYSNSVKQMPLKAGTTILLVHNGEPRNSFYAKNQLMDQLNANICLSKRIGE